MPFTEMTLNVVTADVRESLLLRKDRDFQIYECKNGKVEHWLKIDQMAHFFFFSSQIVGGGLFRLDLDGNALDYFQSGTLQSV
jgi:hypothetical protein